MDQQSMVVILGACLAVSEALSLIPGVKANGIFQLIYGIIKGLLPKKGE